MSRIKDWFRSAKDKVLLAVGAVALTTLGAAGAYFAYEKMGYDKNVHVYNATLDHVVYGGDGGISTPQRLAIVKSIARYKPTAVRLLGDVCYPVGCVDWTTLWSNVYQPFGDFGDQHLDTQIIGGNHSSYSLKEDERNFMVKFFVDGKRGKVSFDNYYSLRIYNNACEVSYESTVYDVLVGDPPMQKRQEDFVCKALVDERCQGKLKIVLTHQAAIGKGKRGNTKSQAYMDFDQRCIRNQADYVLAGHEHEILYSGYYGKAHYIIAGSLAKLTRTTPGYLTLDDNTVSLRPLNTTPTWAEEDED